MRELNLSTDGSCAARARDFAARCMRDAGIGEDEAFDMLLALNEAVGNACRHAFRGSGSGEVIVRCEQEGDDFLVTVRDSGTGFPFSEDMFEMPDPLSMRGRGFFLMRELMDEVDVRTEAVGTVISMRRRIKRLHLADNR